MFNLFPAIDMAGYLISHAYGILLYSPIGTIYLLARGFNLWMMNYICGLTKSHQDKR
ncbi:hypothetical protein [Algoriphagus ratkowskyi]|uniref:hypothetical protein n=1 Tax=Algoriphagus ratkowskyi TaxID=57028 RepID=UPI0013029674|nr:hypothetical protein [Algoriphagus ratkowskyi]